MGAVLSWCDVDNSTDAPFWDEASGAEPKPLPPLAIDHLPKRVRDIAPLLAITARQYDRYFDCVRTLDFNGLADTIITRYLKTPPVAQAGAPERFDLRDILAKQEDYDTLAHIVEGRVRLLRSMEQRAA